MSVTRLVSPSAGEHGGHALHAPQTEIRRQTRRALLTAGAGVAALPLAGQAPAQTLSVVMKSPTRLLGAPTGRRIVVAGGGWGGLTAARHLREQIPDAEVILIERNPVFWSCPLSNKWLVDVVDTSFLVHDYLTVAARHGWKFLQAEITAIERDTRRVHTSQGYLEYDYLVVSAGIRYNYAAWFGEDRETAHYTRTHFPAAYIPSAEHLALKKKIHNFRGGDLVLNLPPPPQRCPPSPYERACLIAAHFKRTKVKGKIWVLDHKDDVRPIGIGFKDAFEELYKGIIEYVPNARIQKLDPYRKVIDTAAGQFRFDDAILMAPHQAADMVWNMDAIQKGPDGKPTGWGAIDNLRLTMKDDDRVYIIGDAIQAVSPLFGFYPKSGHIANRLARITARYLAARLAGREIAPMLPDNLCFMLVNLEPREAIMVDFKYKLLENGQIFQTQDDINDRDAKLWAEDLKWADEIFGDMLV